MAVTHYRELIAWQRAMELAEATYAATRTFPVDERFGLTSQLRRCAVSVPSNIAEGQGRGSTNEFRHFLFTAMGSLQELETQFELARRFGFIDDEMIRKIYELADETGRITRGLIKSLPSKT